uniref:Uncharacterized protein n=1 Tax=Tanacetum cinerariifolium TaxID=118510 RepID=A0A6L2NAZ6_TANCI|nr:hypothetical protein [Tanacetum cinerariifolium]
MHDDLTYTMLHDMMMDKFNLEPNYPLKLSAKLSLFDETFDITDDNEVLSTWMAFGGNTRDLGSFGEETDDITNLHQILEEVLLTKHRDGVACIKQRRHDLFSDSVWNLETASGRGQLKEDIESST